MGDQKGKRLAIVDGRYVGFVDDDFHIANDDADWVVLEETLELVSALIPHQTSHGIAMVRICTVHPIAPTQGPKVLSVRYSTILFVDTDLDEQEQKDLRAQIKNCLDNVRQSQARRSTGLILPSG